MISNDNEISMGLDIVNTESFSDTFGTAIGGSISLPNHKEYNNVNPFVNAWKFVHGVLSRQRQLHGKENLTERWKSDVSLSSFITVENEFEFHDFYIDDDDFQQMSLSKSNQVEKYKKMVRFDVKTPDDNEKETSSFNPIFTSTPSHPAVRRIQRESKQILSKSWSGNNSLKSRTSTEMHKSDQKTMGSRKVVFTFETDSSESDVEDRSNDRQPQVSDANESSSLPLCQTVTIHKDNIELMETDKITIMWLIESLKMVEDMLRSSNNVHLRPEEILQHTSSRIDLIHQELHKYLTKNRPENEMTDDAIHDDNEGDDDVSEYMGINLLDRCQYEL